ncbi:unnamed protein product [Cylicocyclus nassatus]|uniref:Uncharacterized protein n=1 Tax=Cylicocyclus nassatus TaxID=53992 RepID=A0AA36GFM4_CYLNA|nr:unnamed protein product [Cylicocyclus nassatus]
MDGRSLFVKEQMSHIIFLFLIMVQMQYAIAKSAKSEIYDIFNLEKFYEDQERCEDLCFSDKKEEVKARLHKYPHLDKYACFRECMNELGRKGYTS